MLLSREIELQRGIDLCQEITDILNARIREQGFIDRDDQTIWDNWLHKRSNEDWEAIFTVLAELSDHMSPSQSQQILDAMAYYRRNKHKARCMDRDKNYKKPAWSSIMVTREVMNSIAGIYIANRPERAA